MLLSPRSQRFGAVPAIRIRDNLDRAVDSWCQNARRTYDVRGPWGSRHAQDGERMGLAPPWYFETMKSTLLTMDKRNPPRPRSTNKRDVTTKEGSPGSGVGIVSTRPLRGAEGKEAGRRCPASTAPATGCHGSTSAGGLGTRVRSGLNAATLIPARNQIHVTASAHALWYHYSPHLMLAAYPCRNWMFMPNDSVKIALQLPGRYQERIGAHLIHFPRS